MLTKLVCKVVGHRWSEYAKGKKATVFEVRVCQRCSKQQRRKLSASIPWGDHKEGPSVPVEPRSGDNDPLVRTPLVVDTKSGEVVVTPGIDQDFIARAKYEWNYPRKPWPEDKGVGE